MQCDTRAGDEDASARLREPAVQTRTALCMDIEVSSDSFWRVKPELIPSSHCKLHSAWSVLASLIL